MPRNGSGVFTPFTPGNPVVAGTTIDPVAQNNTVNDIATAMTNSAARNGEGVPTANWPMAGFKLTGLGNGTTAGDSLAYGQSLGPVVGTTGNFSGLVTATGVAVGGALTTATTGSFSGLLSATGVSVGGPLTAATTGNFSSLLTVSGGISDGTNTYAPIVGKSRAANGTRVSNNGLTDDSDLVCAVGTGTYAVRLYLPVWGNSGCGIRFTVTCSGTATGQFSWFGTINGSVTAASSAGTIALGTGANVAQTFLAGPGPGSADVIRIDGDAVVTVAGNLKLQWGQSISNPSAMTIGAGAWMTCTKVA